jgi:predicted N-acetyltransferase YhbS
MLEIYNIKDKQEYLREVAILTQKEWGTKNLTEEEFDKKIEKKINKIISLLDRPLYAKLILIKDDNLVGFISIFPVDGEDRKDLSPWYATMYVKKEYRGNGYSKMLNDAILEEARRRGFKKIYLKTDLVNYYEKFGAKYIEKLSNGESLYYIDL